MSYCKQHEHLITDIGCWPCRAQGVEAEVERLRDEVATLKLQHRAQHNDMQTLLEIHREAKARLAEVEKVIPPTFYAGADLIFRQVQLVRIWNNAIKANQDLEARLARVVEAAQPIVDFDYEKAQEHEDWRVFDVLISNLGVALAAAQPQEKSRG